MTDRRTPTRRERDEQAWNDPRNWIGPRWLGIYKASDDSRLFVPKRIRLAGWTLNFGHPSARWFFVVLALLCLFAFAATQIL